MRVRKKHIRSLVERLLTAHSIKTAPVPVEELVNSLKIEIRKSPAEGSLSGFILRDGASSKATIGVNSNQHRNRQRFTIGHELGHYLLHSGHSVHVDDRSVAGLKINLRNAESGEGTNVEEIEANLFAAELLMPASLLEEDLKAYGALDFLDEDSLDEALNTLAKKYQVSKQAITFRLVNLEYVHL